MLLHAGKMEEGESSRCYKNKQRKITRKNVPPVRKFTTQLGEGPSKAGAFNDQHP
jgi:hypothetical protein